VDDLLDSDALPMAGLTEDRKLPMPTRLVDGRLTMGPIVKPKEWARTHYSVAVVAGARAIVGPSVAVARVAEIKDAAILERVDHQLIVFDWPGEAAQVSVYLAAEHSTLKPTTDEIAHATLTRQDFMKRGGLVMGAGTESGTGRALRRPCRVYLYPEFFEKGRIVPSHPTACDYPGLVQIRYHIQILRAGRRSTGGTTLLAQCELASPPLQLTLVWRPDRLPLHSEDGTILAQPRTVLSPTMRSIAALEWIPSCPGYFRLFVNQIPGSMRIAVMDPPLSELRTS
jgi:hypothetical protein